ncbi:MAG: hypothetical protein A3I05_01185 [Deltaproteobacteria bacterium RIFCSPLOWO2_02_FULL_44_10]|nr:MAG: hypothetical protein A3C46_02430 [Deltaproteobacteria bacterium RIFCSPHIGHO2_02_FULL_44_16]OGQ47340.1 MAG: hypothetical protein A3I05_01185 [Deltaproteobacteria bacterium RIFCSPLOWO2_02_FULL_44_10]
MVTRVDINSRIPEENQDTPESALSDIVIPARTVVDHEGSYVHADRPELPENRNDRDARRFGVGIGDLGIASGRDTVRSAPHRPIIIIDNPVFIGEVSEEIVVEEPAVINVERRRQEIIFEPTLILGEVSEVSTASAIAMVESKSVEVDEEERAVVSVEITLPRFLSRPSYEQSFLVVTKSVIENEKWSLDTLPLSPKFPEQVFIEVAEVMKRGTLQGRDIGNGLIITPLENLEEPVAQERTKAVFTRNPVRSEKTSTVAAQLQEKEVSHVMFKKDSHSVALSSKRALISTRAPLIARNLSFSPFEIKLASTIKGKNSFRGFSSEENAVLDAGILRTDVIGGLHFPFSLTLLTFLHDMDDQEMIVAVFDRGESTDEQERDDRREQQHEQDPSYEEEVFLA